MKMCFIILYLKRNPGKMIRNNKIWFRIAVFSLDKVSSQVYFIIINHLKSTFYNISLSFLFRIALTQISSEV